MSWQSKMQFNMILKIFIMDKYLILAFYVYTFPIIEAHKHEHYTTALQASKLLGQHISDILLSLTTEIKNYLHCFHFHPKSC